jgi:tetraacyldisaccharide 4'-kinase
MKIVLVPFSWLFGMISGVRNFLYDQKVIKSQKISCAVMSVGNITAGGTGKTPVTAALVEFLKTLNLKVGLVSRGYRGNYQGIQKVPGQGADAKVFGDEPTWLAQELQVPVYVGRAKVEAAQCLQTNEKVDWIIADDAFQHRKLQRDFDIVILDVTEPIENYKYLPLGRARESLRSLRRADFIVLNKINFISEFELTKWQDLIRPLCRKEVPVVGLAYTIENLLSLQKEGQWSIEILRDLKIFLVSGLGRPQSFESLLKEKAQAIVGHLSFRDHHHYTSNDVKDIEAQANQLGADAIIITQKDAIKLRSFSFSKPVFVTCLGFEPSGLKLLQDKLGPPLLAKLQRPDIGRGT